MTLASQATSQADLRKKICDFLQKHIPGPIPGGGLSSDDQKFINICGPNYSTPKLRANWAAGGQLTSCNAFAGWVARQIGAPAGSELGSSKLDLSKVEREVPGSWVWANTGEAIEAKLHPLPGDFYCSSKPGQPWAHVGIVFEIDPMTQTWKWVAGGQGGPIQSRDWIKWGPWRKEDSRTFIQARPNVMGWVDIGYYFFPKGP